MTPLARPPTWRFFISPSRANARLDLSKLPAAHLRAIVGPLATPKAGAGRSRQRDIIGHRPGITEHISNISGPIRALSDTRGSSRAVLPGAGYGDEDGRRVPYGPSPDHVRSVPSCAVWPVAGHGGEDGRRVRYGPSPDRVRYGPSPDRVRYGPSPDRVSSGVSRAVALVAGHGGEDGCRVRYGLSPDHVPYRPSPTHVSSQLGPPSATSESLP